MVDKESLEKVMNVYFTNLKATFEESKDEYMKDFIEGSLLLFSVSLLIFSINYQGKTK